MASFEADRILPNQFQYFAPRTGQDRARADSHQVIHHKELNFVGCVHRNACLILPSAVNYHRYLNLLSGTNDSGPLPTSS